MKGHLIPTGGGGVTSTTGYRLPGFEAITRVVTAGNSRCDSWSGGLITE
jgi:hypothetical protein